MNLQHERITLLCEALSLLCVAQVYGAAAQHAAKTELGYSDFLKGLLKEEAVGRRVRKQTMMTRLAGFSVIKTLDDFSYDFSYDFAKGVKKKPNRGARRPGLCRAPRKRRAGRPQRGGQDAPGHRAGLPGRAGGHQDAVHDGGR